MKKKRTICIKDPKLRKIRDNFRDLWLEWGTTLWKELFDERRAIEYNESGRVKDPSEWSKEERAKIYMLGSEISRLRNFESASICMCTVCYKGDRDMTYNPVHREWYCVDCYNENREFYKGTVNSSLYP